jgi:hypothetical protein
MFTDAASATLDVDKRPGNYPLTGTLALRQRCKHGIKKDPQAAVVGSTAHDAQRHHSGVLHRR